MNRVAELTQALESKITEIESFDGAIKEEDREDGTKGFVVSTDDYKAYRKLVGEAEEIKGLIEAEHTLQDLREFAREPEEKARSTAAAAAAAGAEGEGILQVHAETLGKMFTSSSAFQDFKKTGKTTMDERWEIEGIDLGSKWAPWRAGAERKDVFTASPTGTARPIQFGRTEFDPMVPLQMRTVRVRDLFPVQQTDANLIDYFRAEGFTNNASPVPERTGGAFSLKAQSSLNWTEHQAPVRTVAHFEVAHRNVIQDEPQLQGIINTELLYGVRLAEDNQILNGAGGNDLQGILTTSGIQTYPGSYSPPGTDKKADAVRRAMTRVILAYFEATGTVVHPYDWEDIELTKDSQGRYILTTAVAVGAQKTLWRSPVVDTPAIGQGTFLTGAFGLGAQLYDREQANVRIAEQHADFFVRNAVAILAEERLALAVKRPEAFVKGTF